MDRSKTGRKEVVSTLAVAQMTFEALDTPVALASWLMVQYREFEQLAKRAMPKPSDYLTHEDFADDYLATSLLSKYAAFADEAGAVLGSLDPLQTAKEKFWAAEAQCRETNRRFRAYRLDPIAMGPAISSVLHGAARKIAGILGSRSSALPRILAGMGFGPGVSSSCKGVWTAPYNKFQAEPEATADCKAVGAHLVMNAHHPWPKLALGTHIADEGFGPPCSVLPEVISVVKGNTVSFVPKNAKTHRAIAVEPHLNIFLQKGVGNVLRQKLKTVGQNLDDQTKNQRLARQGSITGRWATIDLSSASDTVAIELVRELLPEPWFDLLDALRSKDGLLDGKWFRYHKFSSMGNGFTFELESLIFWALASSVTEYLVLPRRAVSVYGDDIVIPVEAYDLLVQVLSFCGFSLNAEKSYHTGPFRESCGKDYYFGHLVRPVFFKDTVVNVLDIYYLHNSLTRYSNIRMGGLGRDKRFAKTVHWLRASVPSKLRHPIPEGVGDGGLLVDFDEACPPASRKVVWGSSPNRLQCWLEGFSYIHMVEKPLKREGRDIVAMFIHSVKTLSGESPSYGRYSGRGTKGIRAQVSTVRSWTHLGGWM